MKIKNILFGFFLLCLVFVSCNNNNEALAPKPRGYFRIDLPQKKYQLHDTLLPFSFFYPVYSNIEIDSIGWFNIAFPNQNAKIHFSYKKINNNLYNFTEDTHNFVYKHVPKATDIRVEPLNIDSNRVFSLIYFIEGQEAASPIQFYATDSINHFLRGALYFSHYPNNDSVAPLIEFIKKDIIKFIETLSWK